MPESNTYRSSEMVVVTYLRMQHIEAQDIYWDDKADSCYWAFVDSAVLQSFLEDLQTGRALVDPIEFNREFARTRNEMFRSQEPKKV